MKLMDSNTTATPGESRLKTAGRIVLAVGVVAVALTVLSATPASADDVADSYAAAKKDINTLAGGLAWYALMMCLVGTLISASLWAIGSKGQNPGQELTGKKGFVVCFTAAFFVGAAPGMINYLNKAATTMDRAGVTNVSDEGFSNLGKGLSPVGPAANSGLGPAGGSSGGAGLGPAGNSLTPSGGTSGLGPAGNTSGGGAKSGLGPAGNTSGGGAKSGLGPAGNTSGGSTAKAGLGPAGVAVK